jgi:hypothetical protein
MSTSSAPLNVSFTIPRWAVMDWSPQPSRARCVPADEVRASSWWSGLLSTLAPELRPVTYGNFTTVVEILNQCYTTDPQPVTDFLLLHEGLPTVVLESLRRLRLMFGTDARVSLDLMRNPEEDYEELFALVESSVDSSAAFDALCRLDREWLLTLPAHTRALFNVALG